MLPRGVFESRAGSTNVAYYVVGQAQAGWNKDPRGGGGGPTYVQYPSKYVSSELSGAYANAAKQR